VGLWMCVYDCVMPSLFAVMSVELVQSLVSEGGLLGERVVPGPGGCACITRG
jgi:hypothetical protein